MKGRRIFAYLLTLVLIASMVPAIQTEADAYTTPPTISVGTLTAKIDKLSNLLEGKYFTTTQQSCGNNVCDACMNTNVMASTWFKNLFGEVSVSQIPGHAYPYGESGTAAGWTCHGFANFAQWYLFSTKNTDKVTNYRVVDNVSVTRANMLKYAKPGDIIRYTYNIATDAGHSMIFISANEYNFTVLDNNFCWNGDAKSCVRTHTIAYDSSIPMAISRATNYPTTPSLTMTFSANGGTVEGNSDEVIIDTEMLRIRETPSLSGTVLGLIPNGTVVKVQETTTAEGYTWGKVTYDGTTGWSALTGFVQPLGYYLEGDIIYQSGSSEAYKQIWNYGAGGTLPNLELSKEGYRFLGWSTSPDGTEPIFDPSDTSLKAEDIYPGVQNSDKSITLYAVWEDLSPKVYTFQYQGNGATGTMSSQEAQKDATIQLAANQFYKESNTFEGWHLQRQDGMWYTGLGWSAQESDSALLTDGASLTLDDSFLGTGDSLIYTLYAVWKEKAIAGISVLTPPTKTKYTLNSQFDSAGMTVAVLYQDGSSAAINQGFTVNQTTFTQLGQVAVEVEYRGFTAQTMVTVYQTPVLSLGDVSGYLDEVVTLPVICGGNANAECYGFSVTLDINPTELLFSGYSAAGGIEASYIKVNQTSEGQIKIEYRPNAPVPANTRVLQIHLQIKGQSQTAWVIEPTEAVFFDAEGNACNMEVTSGTVTSRGMLTVRYDVGQGTNAPAPVQASFGQQLQVSTRIPVREGYIFSGWAIYSSANVAYYQGGDTFTCLSDMVLYAVWEKDDVVKVPTLTLNYPTLSFEDQIQYNVYYTVSNSASIAEMGLITFNSKLSDGTIADAVDVISGYSHSDGTYMVHTNGIPGKNLGDALYFKVYAKLTDGTYAYSPVAGYNAVAYAKTVLNSDTASRGAKALVVAMLNYGAASQVYFDYKTDALMNDFLTDTGKALVSPYDSSMVSPVMAADSARAGHFVMDKTAFTGAFPSVSFEGAFSINYYFTIGLPPDSGITFCYWDAKTYKTADKLTTANTTGMVQMVRDGDRWFACVDGIAAKDMDQTVYVAAIYKSGGKTYTTSVIAYSLGKYCQTMADSGNALGAATAVYGYYAKEYFAS